MASDIEIYLGHLDDLVGGKGTYHLITEKGELPPLWVIAYPNTPEDGDLTAFTYGLSSVSHPKWKLGRPELVICVNSNDLDWGLAVGLLAKQLRGQCPFSYGNTVRFGRQITGDSLMSAFLVFAPSILERDQLTVELPDRTINFAQMYPIYEREIEFIERKGVKAFLDDARFDPYDVRRPVIA